MVLLSIWLWIWYFKRVIKPKFLECPFFLDAAPTIADQWQFERTSALCNPLVHTDQCSFLRVLYTGLVLHVIQYNVILLELLLTRESLYQHVLYPRMLWCFDMLLTKSTGCFISRYMYIYRDSPPVWPLCAFFFILLQFMCPSMWKRKKLIILCAFWNLNALKD